MHVIRRRGWEIPERLATPERLFLDRRGFLATAGAAALLGSGTQLCRCSDVERLYQPLSQTDHK